MESKPYFVYSLQSIKSNILYVGMSDDINRRIKAHNNGNTKSTSSHIPWKLVYCEMCSNRKEARAREKYLKSGYGKEQLKLFIINYPQEYLDCNFTFKIENHHPFPSLLVS